MLNDYFWKLLEAKMASICQKDISSKTWFLTFNEELLIWKNGHRLKLKDGSSSGPVEEVEVDNEAEKILSVSYVRPAGSLHAIKIPVKTYLLSYYYGS